MVPKISILIPAYNYNVGILRILQYLIRNLGNDNNYEIIISDDSSDDEIENSIHTFNGLLNLKYYRNNFNVGAPENWNNLINLANGEYIHFLHHDELPCEHDFYQNLEKIIIYNPDLIILNCKTSYFSNCIYNSLTPIFLKKILISYIPKIILRINFIGSPSNIVVKRILVNKFDQNLKWLVDVDWYYRLILSISIEKINFSKFNSVFSINYNKSITKSLYREINLIGLIEDNYIYNKYKIRNGFIFNNFVLLIKLNIKLMKLLNFFSIKFICL